MFDVPGDHVALLHVEARRDGGLDATALPVRRPDVAAVEEVEALRVGVDRRIGRDGRGAGGDQLVAGEEGLHELVDRAVGGLDARLDEEEVVLRHEVEGADPLVPGRERGGAVGDDRQLGGALLDRDGDGGAGAAHDRELVDEPVGVVHVRLEEEGLILDELDAVVRVDEARGDVADDEGAVRRRGLPVVDAGVLEVGAVEEGAAEDGGDVQRDRAANLDLRAPLERRHRRARRLGRGALHVADEVAGARRVTRATGVARAAGHGRIRRRAGTDDHDEQPEPHR
jgi:hypothetical protein